MVVVVVMGKNTESVPQIKPWHLNKKDMAAACGVSVQAFTNWGVQPLGKVKNSVYFDVHSVIENRVQNAIEKVVNTTSTTPSFEIDEIADPVEKLKAKKLEQEIVALELKNGVLEGKNLPATVVTEVITRVLSPAISIFETLPLEITRRYPEIDQRAIRDIEKEIAKIRNEAAEVPQHLDEILDDIVSEAEERIT